jgi:purine-binding chemotaxis protein CheW
MLIEEILIVRHSGIAFGVPTSHIGQILRVPDITALALSPSQVCGLCAVGGDIVTVLDFNSLLGLPKCEGKSQKNRVITLISPLNDLSLGVDPDKIEYLDSRKEAIIAILHHDNELIQIVDLEYAVHCIHKVTVDTQSVNEKNATEIKRATQTNQRYLVFKMGVAEYAILIDNLREILHADIVVTPIAGANPEIQGVALLRDELIVIADLRRYSKVVAHISDKNRIMIVERHGKTLGLVIDEIVDIHEFAQTDFEVIHETRDNSQSFEIIKHGERLISLVGEELLDAILRRNEELIVTNEVVRTDSNSAQVVEVVVFQLGNEEYAFNIEEVAEIIDMTSVTPIVNAPKMVDGVINIRGQIVTIGSLYERLGITAPIGEDQKIIICHASKGRVGFFVNRVSDVMGITREQMHEDESESGMFSNVLHLDGGKRLVLLFKPDILKLIKGVE